MSIKTCDENTSLTLDPELLSILSENAAGELQALDDAGDGDGAVIFEEAQGSVLTTAGGFSEISIENERDFAVYAELIQSHHNVRSFARFAEDAPTLPITAEAWVSEKYDELTTRPPLRLTQGEPEIAVLDVKNINGDYYLLLRRSEENNAEGNYYYTVRLPQKEPASTPPCAITMELGGRSRFLSLSLADPNLKAVGNRTLLHLIGLLNAPIKGLPESVRLQHIDHVEAILYKQGVLDGVHNIDNSAVDERKQKELTRRLTQSQNRQMPVRNNFELSGGYQLPLLAEKPLSDTELTRMAEVLKSVPSQLYAVLNKNEMLPPLYFEIVEDDLMDFSYGGALGVCDRDLKKFFIRRSALGGDQAVLQEIVVHELAHGVFPIFYWDKKLPSATYNYFRYDSAFKNEASDYYLISDCWEAAVKKAKVNKDFPGISIYSLDSPMEFFAECSLAYLSGEEDKNPWNSSIHGSKSRAELRQKQPEMYSMLKLFYDADSPYLGDKAVFLQDAKQTIAALVLDKVALSPKTTGAELAEIFDAVKHMQEN